MGALLIIFVALIIIGVIYFVAWQWDEDFELITAFVEFEGSLKMAMQSCGYIKKDLAYANYIREVLAPKRLAEKERKRLASARELVEKRIIDAIEENCDRARIDLDSSWRDEDISCLPFEEAMDIIREIGAKYGCGEINMHEYSKMVYITIKKSED